MNKIIKWLLSWLNRRQGGTGEVVTPQPEKPAEPIGLPCSGLPITATLSNVTFGRSRITWTCDGEESWPKKTVKKEVQAQTFLYTFRDGAWRGGKYDWATVNQVSKDHKNLLEGYNGTIPASGDRVAFGLVDVANTQRSNFIEGVWP